MSYYGFNFLWMFSHMEHPTIAPPDEKALDFLSKTGFNFVRIPTDYHFWTHDFDYLHPDETVLETIDTYLNACRSRGLHMSLNLHRAPGYCINANQLEKHNLWVDNIAQDAFVFLWRNFAERYKGISPDYLSFDLINEPPGIGQYSMTRRNHAALIRRVVAAIRAIDPTRAIVIDGLGGGHLAMPELADLDVVHSGRGYQPMPVSHHQAPWWPDHAKAPEPVYPGQKWQGRTWNRQTLLDFYQPWQALAQNGVKIHIGECGCFDATPNIIALRWLSDLFSVYKELGWGYALWNFEGPFGIINHHRPGARFEMYNGYPVDRELLDLMLANRID